MTTDPTTAAVRPHPAPYSPAILARFAAIVAEWRSEHDDRLPLILDPMAGVGRIHELDQDGDAVTVAVELEPEWADIAANHGITHCADFLTWPINAPRMYDMVMVSPTYGNRMADSHTAKDASTRTSYTHNLGRKLTDNNSGALQWGLAYRVFHRAAWAKVVNECLAADGWFVLNIKDHIRGGEVQPVAKWHEMTIRGLGMQVRRTYEVPTPGMRYGENREARVDHEMIYVFERKPATP